MSPAPARRGWVRGLILFFLLINIFSSAAFSAEKTRTIVTVARDNVLCFSTPEGLISQEPIGKTRVGVFVERRNDYSGIVELKNRRTLAYIPYNLRHIEFKLGTPALLKKNSRRAYQTEWDIISVGEIVGAGSKFTEGEILTASEKEIAQIAETADEIRNEINNEKDADIIELRNEVTTEVLTDRGVSVERVTIGAEGRGGEAGLM